MSINRIQSLLPEHVSADLENPAELAEFQKGEQFLQLVLQRSSTDESFRTALVTDPRPAIAAYYAEMYDDGGNIGQIDLHFVENAGDMTVVLPPFIDPSGELSETELEAVAGGDGGVSAAIASLIVASNMACLGFAAGVLTVGLIAYCTKKS